MGGRFICRAGSLITVNFSWIFIPNICETPASQRGGCCLPKQLEDGILGLLEELRRDRADILFSTLPLGRIPFSCSLSLLALPHLWQLLRVTVISN